MVPAQRKPGRVQFWEVTSLMTAETRPTPRVRPRSPSEAKARRRQWWHYGLAAMVLLVVLGLVWGGYSAWFSMTHVRATYARISGLVVSVSPKGDSRVQRIPVRIGDQVKQ